MIRAIIECELERVWKEGVLIRGNT